MNGDGYADVIVGAPYYDNGQEDEGRAFVYHGSAVGLSAAPDWTAESNQAWALFGYSVGTAGDVNHDGYDDVIVGAPYYDNGQTDEGRALVYHGSASGLSSTPNWTAESDQAGARFGFAVGAAGNVNGDSYADVIVGAPYYDNGQEDEGRAFVYHGSASGLAASANWTAESNLGWAYLGYSVGTAGDVNNDGYDDVIVGAPYYHNGQTDEGRALVYHGSASGLAESANWTAESDQGSARLGFSVASAGDVNHDGYDDVIVGAPYYDNGQTDEGRAFVYHGSASGPGAAAAWTAESDQTDARLGYSVGTAGDVNGDGYADVVAGAPYYDDGQTDEGRAYVYRGSASGLGATADRMVESDMSWAYLGASVGAAGDVNGDGLADVIVGAYQYASGEMKEGNAFVYYGSGAAYTTQTTTIWYTYDPLQRLTSAGYSGATTYTFAYAYDAVGNRAVQTQTITSTLVTTYTYDAANRLTNVNTLAGTGGQAYTWDNNGNLTGDGSKTYTYTQANRLTAVSGTGLSWSATYNGDGARLKQVANSTPTTYTQDLAAPLPVVLQARTGNTNTLYLFSMDTRPLAEYDSAWEYLLPDGLGSVRQLVDAGGNVKLTESYEPYGSVLSSQGSATSAFGFTGEQFDAYIGLMFLRARYMQPWLGVFLSRDPWEGSPERPITLNKYGYAEQNPILYADPSGECVPCIIAILLGLALAGCTGPSPNTCPALPDSPPDQCLTNDCLSKISRQEALGRIQSRFGIKLPPATTIIYPRKTATYRFVHSQSHYGLPGMEEGISGYAPWFDEDNWGQVFVYELTFTYFDFNAYDIAGIMVHEATHAWYQYSVAQRARTDSRFIASNLNYYETKWSEKYGAAMEVGAYQQVLNAWPNPICLSQTAKRIIEARMNEYAGSPQQPIPGIDSATVPLIGYPLP